MARTRGTNSRGGSFSAAEVQAVWNKGTAVSGYDASRWRKDACGAWMDRLEYGNTDSKQGWEVDHFNPFSGRTTGERVIAIRTGAAAFAPHSSIGTESR
jgi:hypothetical protein